MSDSSAGTPTPTEVALQHFLKRDCRCEFAKIDSELSRLRAQRQAALDLMAPEAEMALVMFGERYFSEASVRAALGATE